MATRYRKGRRMPTANARQDDPISAWDSKAALQFIAASLRHSSPGRHPSIGVLDVGSLRENRPEDGAAPRSGRRTPAAVFRATRVPW